MKVTVNVECSPEEARSFLGLPDVQPMQEALMLQLQERMSSGLNAMAPEKMFSTWFPAGMQNAEQLQKMFWEQLQSVMGNVTNATTSAMVKLTDQNRR